MTSREKRPADRARAGKSTAGRSVVHSQTPPQADVPRSLPVPGTPGGAEQLSRLKRRARDFPQSPDTLAQDEEQDNDK